MAVAVERMTRFGFSALPVVTGSQRLVGIVSLLDVLRHRQEAADRGLPVDESAVAVDEIMTAGVLTMPSTANAATVAGRLRHNGELRVLPVVASGRLVGVVTRGDLLRRTLPGAPARRRRGLFGLFEFRAADDGVDWATLVALGVGDIVAIDFMQRIFSAKSPKTAQRACFVGAAGTVIVGIPYALVALSTPAIFGDQLPESAVLFALLVQYAPAFLTILVLSAIVAASCSTANGAILGTAAVAVRNIAGLEQQADGEGRDPLLRRVRLTMIPVVGIAIFFALQVPQTGLLLTLAFDLMLAGLIVPFVFGHYWSRITTPAALAAIVSGVVVRLVLFALTPTMYGVENTLLYVPNETFGPGFDGWPTFIAPVVSLVVFVGVALFTTPRPDCPAPAGTVPIRAGEV